MTERPDGFYWVSVFAMPPEIGCWDGERWWLTGVDMGFAPDAVAVLSGPLLPPGPTPRAAVAWSVPPCGDDSGVLHGGTP